MSKKFPFYPATNHMILFESLQDAEGVLVANIGSYMGGVDLWQNEDENYDNFDPQSMHDKILEVVSISGTWHLGKLQVNWFLLLLLCVHIHFSYRVFSINWGKFSLPP
jgi:hypothetical protein